MTDSLKPVLLGQAPSGTGDPHRPFRGRSGTALARAVGATLDELLSMVEAVNLLTEHPGRRPGGKGVLFPAEEARRAARRLLPRLRGRLVLAAGRGAAQALGAPAGMGWFEEAAVGGCLVVLVPHPSGVNLWWNEPANRRLAARCLRALLGVKKPRRSSGVGRKESS